MDQILLSFEDKGSKGVSQRKTMPSVTKQSNHIQGQVRRSTFKQNNLYSTEYEQECDTLHFANKKQIDGVVKRVQSANI